MGAATIPLMVQQPRVESPLQTIGALMSLKGDVANLALKQEQTRQAQQQTELINAEQQEKNRRLTAQNTIQESLKDPTIAKKIATGDTSSLMGVIPEDIRSEYQKTISEIHAKEATNNQTELANKGTAIAKLTDAFTGAQTTFGDDIGKWNENLPGIIDRLESQGYFKQAGINSDNLPRAIGSVDDIKALESRLGVLAGVNEGAQKYKGEQTKQAQEAAAAAESTAKAEHQNIVNKLIQQSGQTPQNGVHPIDQILPASLDPTGNASARAAYDEAMRMPPDENGRRPLAERIAEMASQHAASLSPAVKENKAATAAAEEVAKIPAKVAEEKALAPLKTQQEIAARVGVVQAMNQAGPELADVPIADRDQVRTDYQKSLTELATSAADANRIHGLIQAAQGGNKAAPAVIPLAELRGFVDRVNQSELKSVSGAGSLIDKIQGWVQGKTEGQPIPPDILRATDELLALQVANAEQKHNGEVTAINIARNAKLQAKKAADLGFGPIVPKIRARDPQGKLHEAPAGTPLPTGWKLESQ